MQNKRVLSVLLLIALTGCANVKFREGSVLNAPTSAEDAAPAGQQPAGQEATAQTPANESKVRSRKQGLSPAPYPSSDSDSAEPELQAELSRIVRGSLKPSRQLEQLQALEKQFPKSSGTQYHLGRVYFILNQPEKALEHLEQAISLQNKNFYARNLAGLVHRSQGNFKQARQQYQRAIEIWPDYATGWYNLGVLEDLYSNNLPKALDAYRNYLDIQTSKQQANTSPTAAQRKQLQEVELWIKDLTLRIKRESE